MAKIEPITDAVSSNLINVNSFKPLKDAVKINQPIYPKSIPIEIEKPKISAQVIIKDSPNLPLTHKEVEFTIFTNSPKLQIKAINTGEINFIKLEITGIGISTPIYATGADVDGLIPNAGATINATTTVPVGNCRIVSITGYRADMTIITGSTFNGIINVVNGVSNYEISWKTTPTAITMKNILLLSTVPDNWLASMVNTNDLQTFINNVTGVAGAYPGYTYTIHPSLVNTTNIATDLRTNNGDVASLNAGNPVYKNTAGTVTGTLAGLVATDKATITVQDPSSNISANNGNGVFNISNVTPGTWKVTVTSPNYTVSAITPVTVNSGGSSDIGVVTLTPFTPNITTLSAPNGKVGDSININGTNFHSTIGGNIVFFGLKQATVTSATPTQLTVTVPDGIFETVGVTVSVGTQTSNSVNFSVRPNITGIANAGTEINGTGFSPNVGNNTVLYGGLNAVITSPSTNQLIVTVPGGLSGTVAVTNTVGGLISNTYNVNLDVSPTITSLSVNNGKTGINIQINGTNFDATPGNNTVKFGNQTATVNSGNTTQLDITVPSGIYGQVNVTVTVSGTQSNSKTFDVTPFITGLSSNSGIIGTSIQINGTGFDPTIINNTVKFNGVNAVVNNATNTQLDVSVPNTGSGNVIVTVGTQTSAEAVSFNVLPTISITSPLAGALINGTIPITASVTSGNAVTQVDFYYDGGTFIATDNSAPYSINWDTTVVVSGNHTLTAKVTDSYPNTVTSAGVNVTINQPPQITLLTASPNAILGLSAPTKLTCTASDVDNVLVATSYTWSTDGGNFGIFSSTNGAEVYWTAPDTAGGPYTIRVKVNDGVNPDVQNTVVVTVNSGNSQVNFTGGEY